MNIQGLFPLRLTGLISLLSKGFSKVFSSTTVGKHEFSNAYIYIYIHTHSERKKTVMFIARINVRSSVRGIFCKCFWDSNLHVTSLSALCSVYLHPELQIVQNKLTPWCRIPNTNYSYQVDAFVILPAEVCYSVLLMLCGSIHRSQKTP